MNLSTLLLIAVALAAGSVLVKVFLKKKKSVDAWQIELGEFSNWLSAKKLPRLAAVFNALSSGSISEPVKIIRELRKEIMAASDRDEKFLEMVRDAFYDNLPRLLDDRHPIDAEAIAKAVLTSDAGYAAVEALLESEYGQVIADAPAEKPAA